MTSVQERIRLLRVEVLEVVGEPSELVMVQMRCNRCGFQRTAASNHELRNDELEWAFRNWKLGGHREENDLCPRCAAS